jgi:hypothetical protein
MERIVAIGEAADVLGVSIATLRRWKAAGKLAAEHTAGPQARPALAAVRSRPNWICRNACFVAVLADSREREGGISMYFVEIAPSRPRWTHPRNDALEPSMQFETKIAIVVRTDLEAWQKLNVASFLAGGIAAAFPECVGTPYEDGSATPYLALIGQPILIYGADRPALSRALDRALGRNVRPAVYTEEMFKTTHDEANRAVVKAVARADLNLVGLAMRAERKVIDKIVDGLKFHG